MEENFGRMTNTMSYDSCVNPWHYNFVTLFAGYVPWTLLALLSLFSLTYHKFSIQPTAWWKRFTAWIKNMDPVDLFALTSIVATFIFYCIPQSKRSVYLMPIYPFIAYFLAKYLFYLVKKRSKVIKVYGSILAVLSLLLFACFIAVKCGLIPKQSFGYRHAQNNINFLHAIQNINGIGSFILIAIPTLLGICWWFYQRKYTLSNRFLYAIVALTMGMYIALDGALPATYSQFKIGKIRCCGDRPGSTGKYRHALRIIEAGVRSIGDPVHYFEINFYLGNRIGNFYKDRPSEGVPANRNAGCGTESSRVRKGRLPVRTDLSITQTRSSPDCRDIQIHQK